MTEFQVGDTVEIKQMRVECSKRREFDYLFGAEGQVRAVYADIKVCAVAFLGRILHIPFAFLENYQPGRHVAMSQVEMPANPEPIVDRHGYHTSAFVADMTLSADNEERFKRALQRAYGENWDHPFGKFSNDHKRPTWDFSDGEQKGSGDYSISREQIQPHECETESALSPEEAEMYTQNPCADVETGPEEPNKEASLAAWKEAIKTKGDKGEAMRPVAEMTPEEIAVELERDGQDMWNDGAYSDDRDADEAMSRAMWEDSIAKRDATANPERTKPAGNPNAEAKAAKASAVDGMLTDALHPSPSIGKELKVQVTIPWNSDYLIEEAEGWKRFTFNFDDVITENVWE